MTDYSLDEIMDLPEEERFDLMEEYGLKNPEYIASRPDENSSVSVSVSADGEESYHNLLEWAEEQGYETPGEDEEVPFHTFNLEIEEVDMEYLVESEDVTVSLEAPLRLGI